MFSLKARLARETMHSISWPGKFYLILSNETDFHENYRLATLLLTSCMEELIPVFTYIFNHAWEWLTSSITLESDLQVGNAVLLSTLQDKPVSTFSSNEYLIPLLDSFLEEKLLKYYFTSLWSLHLTNPYPPPLWSMTDFTQKNIHMFWQIAKDTVFPPLPIPPPPINLAWHQKFQSAVPVIRFGSNLKKKRQGCLLSRVYGCFLDDPLPTSYYAHVSRCTGTKGEGQYSFHESGSSRATFLEPFDLHSVQCLTYSR